MRLRQPTTHLKRRDWLDRASTLTRLRGPSPCLKSPACSRSVTSNFGHSPLRGDDRAVQRAAEAHRVVADVDGLLHLPHPLRQDLSHLDRDQPT